MNRILIFISILLLTLSCGQKKDSTSSVASPPPLPMIHDIIGTEVIKENGVTCPGGNCPDALAKIAFAGEYNNEAGVCTAFLIDEDLLMTNAHCIPDYLKGGDVDCSERLVVAFPETQERPAEKAACQKVILAEHENLTLDYGLIRLDRKLNRRPLKINPLYGFKDHQKSFIWSMTPGDDIREGEIAQQECLSIQSSFLNPHYTHKFYPFITLGNCHLVSGNSGSPILNEKGEAIGLANITYFKDYFLNLRKLYPFEFSEEMALMAGGQNFSCLKFPEESGDAFKVKGYCRENEIVTGQNAIRSLDDFLESQTKFRNHVRQLKIPPSQYSTDIDKLSQVESLRHFKWKIYSHKELGHDQSSWSPTPYHQYSLLPTCWQAGLNDEIMKRINSSLDEFFVHTYRKVESLNKYGQVKLKKTMTRKMIPELKELSSSLEGVSRSVKSYLLNLQDDQRTSATIRLQPCH